MALKKKKGKKKKREKRQKCTPCGGFGAAILRLTPRRKSP
jgi:hypothetical protein